MDFHLVCVYNERKFKGGGCANGEIAQSSRLRLIVVIQLCYLDYYYLSSALPTCKTKIDSTWYNSSSVPARLR